MQKSLKTIKIPQTLQAIEKALNKEGAEALFVGGFVRDTLLGEESKDYDVEVYGLDSLKQLEVLLRPYGEVNSVGKSFGVVKLHTPHDCYDFSLPRRESKVAKGHRGFEVIVGEKLSYEEAFIRRDFTMNALGYRLRDGVLIDCFGGVEDITHKRLRHIDADSFVEDPLRVYRGVQFCTRFHLCMVSSTEALMKQMVKEGALEELPKERVFEELKKLLLQSEKPSLGFVLMEKLGVLERYFPELFALIGLPQSPLYHPEGDVWRHTLLSLDAMVKLLSKACYEHLSDKERLGFIYAILCHDLGKATHTTIEEDGRIRSIGHEKAGVEPTRTLLRRLTQEEGWIEKILPLVEHHLKPSLFFHQGAKAGAIRRLSTKVNIEALLLLAEADFLGRETPEAKEGVFEAGEWLKEEAKRLGVLKMPPKPLLQGRDLIALGLKPSKAFKRLLDGVYEKQLEGKVTTKEEALAWVEAKVLSTPSLSLKASNSPQ